MEWDKGVFRSSRGLHFVSFGVSRGNFVIKCHIECNYVCLPVCIGLDCVYVCDASSVGCLQEKHVNS